MAPFELAVAACDAGVVDQHIEAAETFIDVSEHAPHGRFVGDVGLHGDGAATRLADLRRQFVGRVARRRVVQHHVVALGRRSASDGSTDAPARPGDEHHGSFVSHRVGS
jgi:hypothetical protein